MKVSEMVEKLNLNVVAGNNGLNNEITGGYSSDLLSDVMGNAQEGLVWVTLQTHKNSLAVAMLKDLAAIVFVSNLQPNEDTIKQANDDAIPILSTTLSNFEVCGRIYELLKNE